MPRLWLVLGVLASACGPHYRHLVMRDLGSGEGLDCSGYLVWNHEPVRDVFVVINGSGALSNAFVNPVFDRPMSTSPVAYITYDKPGIRAPFGDPAAVRRDDALLERYTLGQGVACATAALGWARDRFGPETRLHQRGHSEGSLVALETYAALLESHSETAGAIKTVVLSGVALEPFADILEHQLAVVPDGKRLRAAIASRDWAVLKERLGISSAYIDDATQRPSGLATFERLAALGPAARFYVFQGTGDWNTPIEPVRALESWNTFTGHLHLEFHYYDGGHGGTDAARVEMARLLAAIVSE